MPDLNCNGGVVLKLVSVIFEVLMVSVAVGLVFSTDNTS